MTIRARIKGKSTEEALKLIADEMKERPQDAEKLSALIDEVLGTGLKAEDSELVGSWEAARRRR